MSRKTEKKNEDTKYENLAEQLKEIIQINNDNVALNSGNGTASTPINFESSAEISDIQDLKPRYQSTILVEKDKTLSDYALQYGTTVETLAKLNNIEDPNLIYENQQLEIPKNAKYPAGNSPKYVNRIHNQKSSILQPIDIKLSDNQNSMFTNICPIDQSACANLAEITDFTPQNNENEFIKTFTAEILLK